MNYIYLSIAIFSALILDKIISAVYKKINNSFFDMLIRKQNLILEINLYTHEKIERYKIYRKIHFYRSMLIK